MYKLVDWYSGKEFNDGKLYSQAEAESTIRFWDGMFYLKMVKVS